jgi:hypothetical protein
MKAISYFFFYGYVAVILLAGLWGAFINPYLDYKILFDLDVYTIEDYSRTNMLSQFRFLRAIELGFGIFSIVFVKDIFHQRKFNYLFLTIMTLGVLGRVVSILVDGKPSTVMLLFMGYELIGVVLIAWYTRKTILS